MWSSTVKSLVFCVALLVTHSSEEVSLDSFNIYNNSMDIVPLRKASVSNLVVTCWGSTRSIIEGFKGSHTKARLVIIIISELIER